MIKSNKLEDKNNFILKKNTMKKINSLIEMLKIILCLLAFNIASVQSLKSHSYSLQRNVNVIANPWLFAKTISKMSCISKCNLDDNCLSVVYSTESLTTSDNCFLYTKYFNINEFFTSENTYLYMKKCKIHF